MRPAEAERRKAERRLRRLTHKPPTPARMYRRWRRRRARRRFPVGVLLLAAGAVAVVVLALAAVGWRDLRSARADVLHGRRQLVAVATAPALMETERGRADATRRLGVARQRIAAARSTVRGSLPLRVAGAIPGLSSQRRAAVRLLDNAVEAGATATALLEQADGIAATLEVRDGALPLEPLSRLEAALRTAEGRLAALPAVEGRPWGVLAEATDEFESAISEGRARLADAADATGAAQTLLGAAGPRRYFLAALNNAEMRDQGMVLSYAIVEVDGGRFSVTRRGSTLELALRTPAPIEVPEGTQTMFGFMGIVQAWQSVNATADFGFSGRAMVAMYEHATGERVDGVIGVDVPALAAVLRVVGPLSVPDLPRPITARNAAQVLLNELYEALPARPDQAERRERLGEVMSAAVARLSQGGFEPLRLARALGGAAAGLHFRVHSQDPAVEDVLVRTGLGGGPGAKSPERTIHFAVQNFTATKLDYFVKPEASMAVTVDTFGNAHVTTTITVVNEAPAGARPSYQLGPDGVNSTEPGQYITQVYFWGPRGALQRYSVEESGLVVSTDPLDVRAGERGQVVFRTTIPAAVNDGKLQLRLVPQPRLWPVPIEVTVDAPDWRISGPATVRVPGDTITTVSWDMRAR